MKQELAKEIQKLLNKYLAFCIFRKCLRKQCIEAKNVNILFNALLFGKC